MATDDWRDSLRAMLPDDYQPEPEPAAPVKLPPLRVELDRRRKGKIATLISGFDSDTLAADTAATLKKKMAVGGSVTDDGMVLLQGDCRQRVADALANLGFKKVRVI